MSMTNTHSFLYFAYGSNMLPKRIHINNPSAEFVDIAELKDHQLNFIKQSKNWGGASATIVPINNHSVWGVVWKLDNKHMASLDRQEGVDNNWYFAKKVTVRSPKNIQYTCRVYQQTINPNPIDKISDIPEQNKPSKTYLEVILKGASYFNLPKDYLNMLSKIPHNNQQASEKMLKELEE